MLFKHAILALQLGEKNKNSLSYLAGNSWWCVVVLGPSGMSYGCRTAWWLWSLSTWPPCSFLLSSRLELSAPRPEGKWEVRLLKLIIKTTIIIIIIAIYYHHHCHYHHYWHHHHYGHHHHIIIINFMIIIITSSPSSSSTSSFSSLSSSQCIYGSEFWTMYNWVQTWGKIKISEVLRATYLA